MKVKQGRFIIKSIKDVFKNFDTAPVLFIGTGISRRYLGLQNWEGLLREMAKLVKDNPLAYEMYSRRAENIGYNVGELQKIAELIEYDLSEIWFEDDRFKDSRERYMDDALKKISPLKIEIAKYI